MAPGSQRGDSESHRVARGRWASVALFAFNTLLVLAAGELAVRGFAAWNERRIIDRFVAAAVKVPYYRDQSWRETYWRESVEVQRRYAPWVGWREAPYEGETLNIDDAGVRRTPGAACEPGAYRIFAFGGSTMWGVGAPDWATIPAYLQKILDERSAQAVCIVNLASIGWVSTQSVVALVLELQRDRKPDLVVFYDGVNDVYAAYQNGHAGDHQNLSAIRARLDDALHSPARELWERSGLYALVRSLAPPPPVLDFRAMGIDTDSLADEVIAVYLANVAAVSALADAYDFRAVFLWQPFLSEGAKPLTPTERVFRSALDPDLVALYAAAYTRARARSVGGDFAYLGDALDGIREPLWIDSLGHLNPPGNERMAQAIAKRLAGDEAAAVALGRAPARRLFAE